MKYFAFISYSHSDSKIARRLHRWLESYRVPTRLVGKETPAGLVPRRLKPIFRDREELPTSSNLGSQITAALMESSALLVICSPRSAASRWVNEEILAFKRQGKANRIFCLIVDGEPNASDKPGMADLECFPAALRFEMDDKGELTSVPVEPIAADLRPGKDGQRDSFLKLAAGLAGVGFDELKQRELQRKLRQAFALSGASLLLLAVMAGLAVSAILARREATRQKEVAVLERNRAEENFEAAKEAVDRFYTKVSKNQLLQAEGLQPLRSELLEEALEYYQGFLSQHRDDPKLKLEYAKVQGNVGEILSELGNSEEALVAIKESLILLEKLLQESPRDKALTLELQSGYESLAVDLMRTEEISQALVAQERAIGLFESLPNESQEKTAKAWQLLLIAKGAYQAKLEQYDAAKSTYEAALSRTQNSEKDVAPLGFFLQPSEQGLLVLSLTRRSPAEKSGLRLGDQIVALGSQAVGVLEDLATARKQLKPGQPLVLKILREGAPMELSITPVGKGSLEIASAKHNLGLLFLNHLGDAGKAKPLLIEALEEYLHAALAGEYQSSVVRQGYGDVAAALTVCGSQLGDSQLYEQGIREGVEISEENVRLNPEVPRFRSSLAVNLSNLAILLMQQGNFVESETVCRRAVEQLEIALQQGGNLESDRFQLFQILGNLGLIVGERTGPEASLEHYSRALEIAAPLLKMESAPEMLPIGVARIYRNYASALRRCESLKESAEKDKLAISLYEQAVLGAEEVPAWLVQERIQANAWRSAVLFQLGEVEEGGQAVQSLESDLEALEAKGVDALNERFLSRGKSIDAFVYAARNLFLSDVAAGEKATQMANEQFNKMKELAGLHPERTDFAEALTSYKMLISSAEMRGAFRQGKLETAYQFLADWLNQSELPSLEAEAKIDLAAGLHLAGKEPEFEFVIQSILNDLRGKKGARVRIERSISQLEVLGFPPEIGNVLNDELKEIIERD
jgi:tetratricopeptide (TPR) repeat protein